MDVTELIKGIEHFYGSILLKAYNSSDWNENGITNAIHWAEFCEQVFENYKDNPCRGKLDELIHSLSLTCKNTKEEFCFEDLKIATKLLCKAFSQNTSVDNNLIESLLLKNDKTPYKVSEEENELNSICIELVEGLKPINIINSERSFYSEIMATLFLKTLEASVQQLDHEDDVEQYLSKSLEKLSENTDKMGKLLHVLMLKITDDDSSSLRDTQEFAINWTMYNILSDKNHPLAQFLWKQTSELRQISLNSSDFLNFYLDFLTECSLSLTDISEDGETVWMPKCSSSVFLSFIEILNHFRSLFATDDSVCECTKNYLLNLINTQPDMLIWKEIFSRIT